MTREQLKANGWIEDAPGHFIKGCDVRIPTPDHQITVGGIEKPAPKRIRQSSKPLLNKLETEWFNICKQAYPEDCHVVPQGIRFMLGNGIWYKPDIVVFGVSVYAYEVKGPHAFRGGFENLKVAAHKYQHISWSLVWKENGQWQEQKVQP